MPKNDDGILVKSTKPIKLKNRAGRNMVVFNLRNTFGFVPEEVIIQKAPVGSNKFILSAVVTPEIQKELDEEIKSKKPGKEEQGVAESPEETD